ncbi:MAG: glycosyltransferase [Nitrospiraceae bacterium]
MNILYLSDPAPDYLADQMYLGLCRVLGGEQVIDYPWKRVYHDPGHRLEYLPQTPGRAYGEDEIVTLLRDGKVDLLVLSSPRAAAGSMLDRIDRHIRLPPCVLIDGEDDAGIRHDLVKRFGCRAYFKREFRWQAGVGLRRRLEQWRAFRDGQDLFHRTFPLPFSVIPDAAPAPEEGPRDIDVSYAARASHVKRLRAWNLLKAADGLRCEGGLYAEPTDRQSKLTTGFSRLLVKLRGDPRVTMSQRGTRLTFREYHRLLGRSKMALSIRGGGFDTLRYWEIPASKAVLVSEQPDICIPNNFEHGKHALFCRPDLSDLVDLVRTYLQDDAARASLALQGHRHLLRFHTCERRAEYFLALCRQHV